MNEDLKPILIEILARLRMNDNEKILRTINSRIENEDYIDKENIRVINESETTKFNQMLNHFLNEVRAEF